MRGGYIDTKCPTCRLMVAHDYRTEDSAWSFHQDINRLFRPSHAKRLKRIMLGTEWLLQGICYGYWYYDVNGERVEEDVLMTGANHDGFKVVNPSAELVASFKGDVVDFLEPSQTPVYHTACAAAHDEFDIIWQKEIEKHGDDDVDFYIMHFILCVLGVYDNSDDDDDDRIKAHLKKTTPAQFDYLEFLLTRNKDAYARYMANKPAKSTTPFPRRVPQVEALPKLTPSHEYNHMVSFQSSKVLSPEFINMISSHGARVSNLVTMHVRCHDSALDQIKVFRRKDHKDATVPTQSKRTKPKIAQSFAGEVVIFSGFRDAKLEMFILDRGGVVKTSFTKTITLVVTKQVSKLTTKVKEAKEKGIRVVAVEQFKTENAFH